MSGGAPVHVAGAGGHAKVVVSTMQACGICVAGVWDDDHERTGREVLGIPVRGPLAAIPAGASVVIAIGSNAGRRHVAAKLQGRVFATVVHPAAFVHPSTSLGAGTVVFAGAIVQPDARLGAHVIVNTGATVDHDCTLEAFVHVAPGVHLAGAVVLHEGAFLGTGVAAIPGIEVGAWATVGAGSVLVRDVAPGVTAVGCPAKTIKMGRTES